jgi:tRNA uridine 5-carboxymethylaminomethyl modification enzyme
MRFADKTSHQIFIEPEGLNTHEIYPNGISTSLPFDVQLALVRTIPGFERAHITRPGYAIEYDYFDPRGSAQFAGDQGRRGAVLRRPDQWHHGLRRSGRAGPVAGINAALACTDREAWSAAPRRSYLGVLVDDLITQRHHRAVSDVHQPRRIPAAAARGQRRPASDASRT